MKMRSLARCAIPLALLAGCASPPPAPPPEPAAIPAPAPSPATPTPSAASRAPALKKETLAHLSRRGLTPISGNPLNAAASCRFRDDTGYAGQLELAVRDALVERLEARVDVPKRGSCTFRLADFKQTESSPIVVLSAQRSACKISLWEQGRQITVAFRDCRSECGGEAVKYLWPILVDNREGSCS